MTLSKRNSFAERIMDDQTLGLQSKEVVDLEHASFSDYKHIELPNSTISTWEEEWKGFSSMVGPKYIWARMSPSGIVWKRLDCVCHSFLDVVRGSRVQPCRGTALQSFAAKLKRLKIYLKCWNIKDFGNIFQKTKDAENDILRKEQELQEVASVVARMELA
ncbi:hypothetical protein ACH5RR_026134 [Cinchona calisaya]|uniref:Uncharacterized protein n=1 Tax=Cinchona calisaya TaxID=153742 RepID=A0ABD2Z1N2_9GENT